MSDILDKMIDDKFGDVDILNMPALVENLLEVTKSFYKRAFEGFEKSSTLEQRIEDVVVTMELIAKEAKQMSMKKLGEMPEGEVLKMALKHFFKEGTKA